jgi:simple sugar transport system ATP-binding protein
VQLLGELVTPDGEPSVPGEPELPAAGGPVPPVVEATGITKHFGGTQALRGVDLTLRPGRCLGLVGRNGAGKSTLVSIMSGLLEPDRGEVRFDGERAPAYGDVGAWRRRIATVFQHSMVVPGLTVAENVFLGVQPSRRGLLDWRRMRAETRRVIAEWGFDIDAGAPCSSLTVEQRQVVEIVRALAAGTRCLLLDEPTAAMERDGVIRLFDRIRQLTAAGVAVLYISHHLEEVFEICQDVAVLRDGELVFAGTTGDLDKDGLVTAMVGPEHRGGPAIAAETSRAAVSGEAEPVLSGGAERRVPSGGAERRVPSGGAERRVPSGGAERVLSVDHISAASSRGAVRDVSLTVGVGERVGVTGLLGAGVVTLGRAIAGAVAHTGTITVGGRALPGGRFDAALRAGVGYIPEDRHAEGFVGHLGVAENVTMTIVDRLANAVGLVGPRRRGAAARPLAESLSIVSDGMGQPVEQLSGGNQQKATAARALARRPRIVVAITPTRGVDVASKDLLLAGLAEATRDAALLLLSDDLDDLTICDRVVVLVRGEVFTEFTEPPFDREALIAATEGLLPDGGDQ